MHICTAATNMNCHVVISVKGSYHFIDAFIVPSQGWLTKNTMAQLSMIKYDLIILKNLRLLSV